MTEDKDIRISCPYCGFQFSVRIVEYHGRLRYTTRCKRCKKIAETVLDAVEDIEERH